MKFKILGLVFNMICQPWHYCHLGKDHSVLLSTKKPSHWKRPWCWERLRAGGEEGNRGWDGWMASLTQWTWVWASSGWWWRTRKPGVLQSVSLKESDTTKLLNDNKVALAVKKSSLVSQLPALQETWVWSLGLEDSPGEGNDNPLLYSCLGNPINRGVWWATVHGVAQESDAT